MSANVYAVALTPPSAAFGALLAALRVRFGAAHVGTSGQSGGPTFAQSQVLLVWQEHTLPPDDWRQSSPAKDLLIQAQRAGKLVIPVTPSGAAMPTADMLPPELSFYAFRQVIHVTEEQGRPNWATTVGQLSQVVASQLDTTRTLLLLYASVAAPLIATIILILGARGKETYAFFGHYFGDQPIFITPDLLIRGVAYSPDFVQVLGLTVLPLVLLGVALSYELTRGRRWGLLTTFGGGALSTLLGLVILLVDRRGYRYPATNQHLYDNGGIAVFLLLAGLLVAAGVITLYIRSILRPVRDQDLRYFTDQGGKRLLSTDVFISYRRSDSGAFCDDLYRDLQAQPYVQGIFRDTRSILGGGDFAAVLGQALRNSRVVLVLIGPGWLDARDASGQRRIAAPRDYVRWEIAEALRAGKTVIPVLVDGARLPQAQELPPELAPLSRIPPVQMRSGSAFGLSLAPLHSALRHALQVRRFWPLRQGVRLSQIWAGVALFLVLGYQNDLFWRFAQVVQTCPLFRGLYGRDVCSTYFESRSTAIVSNVTFTVIDSATLSLVYRSLVYSGIVIFGVTWLVAIGYAAVRRQRGWLARQAPWFAAAVALLVWFQNLLPIAVRQLFVVGSNDVISLLYIDNLLLAVIFVVALRAVTQLSQGTSNLRFEARSQVALAPPGSQGA